MDVHIRVVDAQLSDTHLFVKAVSKDLTDEIHTLKGRDVVEGGVTIMNSEVGEGKYKIVPFIYVIRCKNGLMGEEEFAKIHLGKKKGEGLINWSDKTLQASDKLLWFEITDVLKSVFSKKIFSSWVDKINNVATIEIKEPELAINHIVKSYDIPKNKVNSLLMHFGKEEPTPWGLSNAVTRLAQDMEDYDKQVEMEEVGRKILEDKALIREIQ